MTASPMKHTSPTKRTNHTFPQPPATTTVSPTTPINILIPSPKKRTKKSRTTEQCFIIFFGLACGLAIQISYVSIYHHERRRHGKNQPHSMKQALESSKPQFLRNSDAKKQGPPKDPPQQPLKSNEKSDKLQQNGASTGKQKQWNVYQDLVTPSYNNSTIHEMMSTAGLQYAPCLPPEHECAKADKIRAYNSWHRARYLCGQQIDPKSFVDIIQETCSEGIRVFDEESALKTIDTQPIELFTNLISKKGRTPQPYGCTVPCQQWGVITTLQKILVDGTDFKFQHSMESARNYPELGIASDAWKQNLFYSTTSFQSEVPLPYFSWAEYEIQSPAVQYDSVIKGASFIASNCNSKNEREVVMKELKKMMRVDSLGRCLNNAEPPEGVDVDDKKGMQQKYLFHFAFENSNENDYVTEKLWGTFVSGTLPIYMGAPNVHDHVPDRSIISWHDFNSTQELGEYLQQVAADKVLYESYHAWRTKPLPEKFRRKYDMTQVHSVCRTCKYVYAKQHGWGWNHENQDMQELRLPRKVCVDEQGSIIYPFVETVLTFDSKVRGNATIAGSSDRCSPVALKPMDANLGSWRRTVWFHDGVIDITLEGKSSDIYRITTPLTGTVKSSRKNVYHIQDRASRITIVGDPHLEMSVKSEGVLDIRPSQETNEPQRLRVIVEDVDTFHAGAETAQNYFGKTMVSEFEHPLLFTKAL